MPAESSVQTVKMSFTVIDLSEEINIKVRIVRQARSQTFKMGSPHFMSDFICDKADHGIDVNPYRSTHTNKS